MENAREPKTFLCFQEQRGWLGGHLSVWWSGDQGRRCFCPRSLHPEVQMPQRRSASLTTPFTWMLLHVEELWICIWWVFFLAICDLSAEGPGDDSRSHQTGGLGEGAGRALRRFPACHQDVGNRRKMETLPAGEKWVYFWAECWTFAATAVFVSVFCCCVQSEPRPKQPSDCRVSLERDDPGGL